MKKFANVFELLAEADANGRIAEIKNPLDHSWSQLGLLANLDTLRARFNRGEIRLKPKFKTVEGWTSVHPVCGTVSTTPTAQPVFNCIYEDAEVAKANLRAGCVLAKITFEVEE